MAVIFDWPDEPPTKKGKKRKKGDADGVEHVEHVIEAQKQNEGVKGFAAVTGKWSNDITIYKGSVGKDNIAAVIKGVNPFSKPYGCDYAHSEVIYSLEVIATSPRLTLASASLDGSVRTWELYGSREKGYGLKKPRKGAGDWTCACVMEMPRKSGSSVRPTKIYVVEANTTMAVKCDDRILLYYRGRYSCAGHERVEMSKQPPDERGRELCERFLMGDGPDWSCMASLHVKLPACVCVVSVTELVVGSYDGNIEMFVHDGSSNRYAWGRPLPEDSYNNPSGDPKMRCSNLALKGHTESVKGIGSLSLPHDDVILSISGDNSIRLWQKIKKGEGELAFKGSVLKRFKSFVERLDGIPREAGAGMLLRRNYFLCED